MITWRMIAGQLKKDIIGKDVYRGTTQTYTLLANQFGHFSLGFIPTAILYSIIQNTTNLQRIIHWPWITVLCFWSFFELWHLYHSVITHRKRACQDANEGFQVFPFKASWGNIWKDTFTDIGFFSAGALLAGHLFLHTLSLLAAFLIVFIPLQWLFLYWYRTKMYLQEAQFPFHYRLSQWVIQISDSCADTVRQFLGGNKTGIHLLVFGQDLSQKASLSVGIATELAFKQQRCLYLTAMKLQTMLGEENNDSNHSLEIISLWGWRDASLLIIDDVSPTHHCDDEVFTPTSFLNRINHQQLGELNKKALRNKNVIWVMGNGAHEQHRTSWEQLLLDIGIPKENIAAVHL